MEAISDYSGAETSWAEEQTEPIKDTPDDEQLAKAIKPRTAGR